MPRRGMVEGRTPTTLQTTVMYDTPLTLAATAKGGGGKKGEVPDKGAGIKGAAGARRANLSELKGLVEVRATCQALRAGAGAVIGEGRPLLQVYSQSGVRQNELQ